MLRKLSVGQLLTRAPPTSHQASETRNQILQMQDASKMVRLHTAGRAMVNQSAFSRQNRAQSRRKLELWSLVVDASIWLLGLGVFFISSQTADDLTNVTSNASHRFPLTLTFLVIQLFAWFLLTMFIYWARNEVEIKAKSGLFLIQVLASSGCLLICRIILLLGQYGHISFSSTANAILTALGVQSYYALVSAILLRLLLIYKICVRNELQPVYYTGMILHVPLLIISVIPLYVCHFASLKCSLGVYYTGSWIIWTCYLFEFAFYLWHVRPVPGLFVDFGSNVRIYLFLFTVAIGSMVYTYIDGQPLIVRDMIYILFPFMVWIAWFETFGLVSIKILGRKLGTHWLEDACLQGVASSFLDTKRKTIEFVLTDPLVLGKFREQAKNGLFEEALDALIGCRTIRQEVKAGCREAAVDLTLLWIDKHVTGADVTQHVNIGSEEREFLLKAQSSFEKLGSLPDSIWERMLNIEHSLSFMLRAHVVALFNTTEVVEHCLKLLALMKVGLMISEVIESSEEKVHETLVLEPNGDAGMVAVKMKDANATDDREIDRLKATNDAEEIVTNHL